MSRCDYEGVFYRVFCVSLLMIAFTFTVILTNVFIDIDSLLSQKERGPPENAGVADHITGIETTTELQDDYDPVEKDAGNYRSKRSVDSKQVILRSNSPKTKDYLTKRLAALLEILDEDESEDTSPKTDGNIYIKTVKQKNNIEINELRPEAKEGEQMKADEEIMHLALHSMLHGDKGRVDMHQLLNKLQMLVNNLKNDAREIGNENARSIEQYSAKTTTEGKIDKGQILLDRLLKYTDGKKSNTAFKLHSAATINNEAERTRPKNKNSKPFIKTVIDIKKKETGHSGEDFEGMIKLTYNGKPVKFRGDDSYEATSAVTRGAVTIIKTETTTTNTINKDVEELAAVLQDKYKDKHMPDTYIKTIMQEYFKNIAKTNDSSSTIVRKTKKTRTKRSLYFPNVKHTEVPPTKDDDELFVEIETHFDKAGVKGDRKKKLVSSLIKKIKNAIRSSPDNIHPDKTTQAPRVMKRDQNPIDHGTALEPTVSEAGASRSYRDLEPISKSMPIVEPLPLIVDQNGNGWKKQYQEPKFLSVSKSINSAEMNLLTVDYNQDAKYPIIPKRQQVPLSVDTSGENIDTVDVGKLQLLIKDIKGTGFSIGYNQYVDQAPDPESIKLFHGIENIVDNYHQKHDKPDQLAGHENEYEIYGQEMKKREVKRETPSLSKIYIVKKHISQRQNFKRKEKLVNHGDRMKRSVNVKRIINSNKKMRVSKYLNTKAYPRRSYFKKNKRNKRQTNNINVVNKGKQASEDNNMFIVSDGDSYNDNLMVRHRQKPELYFVEVMKPTKEALYMKHNSFFQPSNQPFTPQAFAVKNKNKFKDSPMFFQSIRQDLIEKSERNKRHTIKIITTDMAHKDSNENLFTEYDEDNMDTYAGGAVITHLDGPQIITGDEKEKKNEPSYNIMNNLPVIYRNPYIIENNEDAMLERENKNPIIFDHNDYSLDPIREKVRLNPLMSKYPHVFVEEKNSAERPEINHTHRSIFSKPESDTFTDTEAYQTPNVKDLVNAIVPSYKNNFKISVKLIPHYDDNNDQSKFKEVHTSINKTFNKNGLLYSSLVNVSEISKVENNTNLCGNQFKPTTLENSTMAVKPILISRGFENMFMTKKPYAEEKDRNEIHRNIKKERNKSTTEATMQMNLMDIILPSSPRRVFHLTFADLGKFICDSIKSQNTNQVTSTSQPLQIKKHTQETTTTTAMPTEAVKLTTVRPERRMMNDHVQTVDPLKTKLLKAISLNEQMTSQILSRIDQNTGILQTFLSKISSEIGKLPAIASRSAKNRKEVNDPNSYDYTTNVTKLVPFAYPIPQKPTQNIKQASVVNTKQNYIQTTPAKSNLRYKDKVPDVQKRIPGNNSDEFRRIEQGKYFIDYDPKSSVPQNIGNEQQRVIFADLPMIDDQPSKLNANQAMNPNFNPSPVMNNMHVINPVNNVIAQNNTVSYLT